MFVLLREYRSLSLDYWQWPLLLHTPLQQGAAPGQAVLLLRHEAVVTARVVTA